MSPTLTTSEGVRFEDLIRDLQVADFETLASRLIDRLDRRKAAIRFDFERRTSAARATRGRLPASTYRHEVQRFPAMTREQELRFCMGLELLWRRLQKARRSAGFSAEDAARFPSLACEDCPTCPAGRERIFLGCVSLKLDPEKRKRLRARHEEFLAARNELIARNLFIVFRLLDRYRHVAVAEDDLIQEANLSLFKAVEGFDFTRGVRFKTYAGYWVNQAFLNAIYNQSRVVRVPAYIQKAMKKIRDASGAVAGDLLDTEGLSRESGVTPELIQAAFAGNRYTVSLDKTVDQESGTRMVDLVPDESLDADAVPDLGERARLGDLLSRAIARLSHRERTVLRLRYGLGSGTPHTLAAVGEALGISLERVRQIQKAALDKLRLGEAAAVLEQYA